MNIKKQNQFSIITIAVSLLFSTSANATLDVWDTSDPWGLSTPTYYAGWDDFDIFPADNTPDLAGSGSGIFTFGVSGAALLTDNNVFTPPNNSFGAYQATLGASSGGFYDLYLRMESIRSLPTDMTAYLVINSDFTGSIIGTQQVTTVTPDVEYEYYWVWNNIPGSSFFNVWVSQDSLTVNNRYTITNLAEIAAVPFATAVPEPETYAMFLAGLGLLGFAARRRNNSINEV